jgi:hypothetical protein
MRVSEAMTRDVRVARPDQSIQDAAKMMSDVDAGVLPVGENDQLVGMITDRDIAIRGIAQGKGPDTPVREVMTADVKYCFEDEDRPGGPQHGGPAGPAFACGEPVQASRRHSVAGRSRRHARWPTGRRGPGRHLAARW